MFSSLRIPFQPNLFSRTILVANLSNKPARLEEKETKEPSHNSSYASLLKSHQYTPNNFERRILVWSGRFKKIEDIPKSIPMETFDKARNKARIKLSNYMMVGTLIGCICYALSGKRMAERGESLEKQGLEWHRQIEESKNVK